MHLLNIQILGDTFSIGANMLLISGRIQEMSSASSCYLRKCSRELRNSSSDFSNTIEPTVSSTDANELQAKLATDHR